MLQGHEINLVWTSMKWTRLKNLM